MIRILGGVTEFLDRFRPATPQEFFALQLARKLDDTKRLRDFLILVQHQSTDVLLRAYRRTVKRGNGNPGDQFRVELSRLSHSEEQ